MPIRQKLTLTIVVIIATILLAFSIVLYLKAEKTRSKEFNTLLKKEAITKANLFFNAQVDSKTLQDIYYSNRQTLNEVEVAIYDDSYVLLYHDAVDIDFVKETQEMLDEIARSKKIYFNQEDWQVVGLIYPFKDKEYIITAAAFDEYGFNKLLDLRNNIILFYFFTLFIIYFSARYLTRIAFKPIREFANNAKLISANSLHLRLLESGNNDELDELAKTFNQTLERLEASFESQKSFVHNISHELRTPLTALITELEIAKRKNQTTSEYQNIVNNIYTDAKKIVKLANILLDMAKVDYDPSQINKKLLRIDEVLIDAWQELSKANTGYIVELNYIKESENDKQLTVFGNEYLLKIAFLNIMENACKFSESKKCIVNIDFEEQKVHIFFIDEGIGIPKDEIEKLFTPFYRATNATNTFGNGIGLALTKKIISLHTGQIEINSKQNVGTTIQISIPTHNL